VVDVEQHALRALEQDALAARLCRRAGLPDRPRIRQHRPAISASSRHQPVAVDARLAEAGAQRIVMGADAVELRAELAEMGQVAHPDRAAADLVLIGRADAAPGRADLAGPRSVLAQRVEVAVEGQDQGAGVGDLEPFGRDLDALLGEPADLVPQRPGIEHDAVADHRERAARRCRRAAATICRSGCRRPACGRHCARPGSARRRRRGWRASRRSCPCPRRPTGRRSKTVTLARGALSISKIQFQREK
jgi:hypothetical protein